MPIFIKKPKEYEAYQFTGSDAAPGWPDGWLDQSPSFEVEIDLPEELSTQGINAPARIEGEAVPIAPLPRAFSDAEQGQKTLTIAGYSTIHEAGPGDWIVRQPTTGEYFVLSDIGFRAIFEEKA